MKSENILGAFILALIIAIITCVAGWLTHVVVCIKAGAWLLLLAGGLVAPIGAIHGWGIWFGWWL